MQQSEPPNRSLFPEELESYLKSYDQIELIATGGMGAIYKARQISLDRPVAIKILTHTHSFSLQFRQIFKQEAKVMAKLNHPSIASIFDYGEINGMFYIVMQFIEGKNLFQISDKKQVAHREAAALITKIADALSKAHEVGILHRDIKPANIIIDDKATPVLVDFGLAHHADETTLKGESVFGTEGYTAPEVINPPYQADHRSDLYALGVLFYELLTGTLPDKNYLHPSELAKVDQRYDQLISDAISPDQKNRPKDAQEFASRLNKIISDKKHYVQSSQQTEDDHTSVVPDGYDHQPLPPITKSDPNFVAPQRFKKRTAALIALAVIGIGISIATIVISYQKSTNSEPISESLELK